MTCSVDKDWLKKTWSKLSNQNQPEANLPPHLCKTFESGILILYNETEVFWKQNGIDILQVYELFSDNTFTPRWMAHTKKIAGNKFSRIEMVTASTNVKPWCDGSHALLTSKNNCVSFQPVTLFKRYWLWYTNKLKDHGEFSSLWGSP